MAVPVLTEKASDAVWSHPRPPEAGSQGVWFPGLIHGTDVNFVDAAQQAIRCELSDRRPSGNAACSDI